MGKSPISIYDDFLPAERRAELYWYIQVGPPGWQFGWRSNTSDKAHPFRFWHKHYAGNTKTDHLDPKDKSVILDRGTDCAEELRRSAPLIWCFWDDVASHLLKGHTLVRCYANGLTYGDDGTLHTDSVVETSYTSVYYPHAEWFPNWGGETVFFNREKTDIVAVSYPRPGRLCVFPGTVPHVARGVSRSCPALRVTLMFKTQIE